MSALEAALQEEGLLDAVLEGCKQTGLSITEFLKERIAVREDPWSPKACAERNDAITRNTEAFQNITVDEARQRFGVLSAEFGGIEMGIEEATELSASSHEGRPHTTINGGLTDMKLF